MIACSNCGRINDETVRLCTYCGSALAPGWGTQQEQRGYTTPKPPPPYSWANSDPPAPLPIPVPPPTYQQPQSNYRCPRCGTNYLPVIENKVSQEGWMVFALMLIFCFPLFWIGLLMKQMARVCPMCRASV